MKPIELKSLYSSEKVSALVSLSKGEGFGLTLLEAAACGLPMVATNDGGPCEIISKCRNGLLVDSLLVKENSILEKYL